MENLDVSRMFQAMARYSSPLTRFVLANRAPRLMTNRLVLVAYTGRKTGRRYVKPVSYVRDGRDLLIPGGGSWWRNVEDRPLTVRVDGSWRTATAEVIKDIWAMSDLLSTMLALNPALSVFTGIRRGADGRPDPKSLERAHNRGLVVLRVYPADEVIQDPVA